MWGQIEDKKIIKIYKVPEILRDAQGTQYPKTIFKDSKKLEDFYIYSVIDKNTKPVYSELYSAVTESFQWNDKDKKIERTFTATAKGVEDSNAKDEDGKDMKDPITGKQIINEGLKTYLKKQVKAKQAGLLAETDKWIIRKADSGDDIPTSVSTYRKDIRESATKMETEIDKIKDINDAVALLTTTYKSDLSIDTPAILYDFPVKSDDMPI